MMMSAHATTAGNGQPAQHFRKGNLLLKALLWGLVFSALLSLILIFELLPPRRIDLVAGQVSSVDIRAPRQVTYVSNSLTDQAREQAEQSVKEVYDPPDPKVGRQQARSLRQIINFIDSVRHDAYATEDEKVQAILSIAGVNFSEAAARSMVRFTDAEWDALVAEAENVLDAVMREPIRSTDLEAVRHNLPTLVSLSLSESQTTAVIALVQDLIRVNSFYNDQATQQAREQARTSVEPVTITVEEGQTIVRQGDIVEPLDLEVLDTLGLLRPRIEWQDVVGNIVLALLVTTLLELYLIYRKRSVWDDRKSLLLASALFLVFAMAARAMVPQHTVLPFLFPAAAMGLLMSTLVDTPLAIFATFLLGILVGAMGGGSLELAVYATAGSVVAIFTAQRVERLNVFVFAGMVTTLMNWAVVLAFRLPGGEYDWVGLVTLLGVGLLNGGLVAMLALLGYFILGSLLDIPTTLRLLDLARPTHPLMRQLLLKAPGTYHHSVLVSNLAEEAAGRIGADSLLARVGAYYHDIGKTVRPYFFVDNQMDGSNVHDRLDPETSAHVIVSHVKDGIDLARKYKLPARIVDFIAEHHGTGLATYFFRRARESAGDSNPQPDPERYRYPGPKPRSKETAIVMLADACEATVRSLRPASAEEIDGMVHKIITERLESGELSESDLTLKDLAQIREAFTATLQGVFHPRVRYPGQEQKGAEQDGD